MNIVLFQLLEENIFAFVKTELQKYKKFLSQNYPRCEGGRCEDKEVVDGEEEEQRGSSRDALLKLTLQFMRRMKQEDLADSLQNSKRLLTDVAEKILKNLDLHI